MRQIWTVGHSNIAIEAFLELLRMHRLEAVADVRRFPASRRHPHFAKDALSQSMTRAGIAYAHFGDLGGRRTPRPDSGNSNWKNSAFRGYADYMETAQFQHAIAPLTDLSSTMPTALLCAEALWWQCHRSLIADYLKAAGWTVIHILPAGKTQEHPYTSAARIVSGQLTYGADSLFSGSS
jgi:uncharacterized protein (DUF488 family)